MGFLKKHLNLEELNNGLPFQITDYNTKGGILSHHFFKIDGVDFAFADKFDYTSWLRKVYMQKQRGILLPKTDYYNTEDIYLTQIFDSSFNRIKSMSTEDNKNNGLNKYLYSLVRDDEWGFIGKILSEDTLLLTVSNRQEEKVNYKLTQDEKFNKKVLIRGDNDYIVYTDAPYKGYCNINFWIVGYKHHSSQHIYIREIHSSHYFY